MSRTWTRRSVLSAGTAAIGVLTGCVSDVVPQADDSNGGVDETQNWPMHRYNIRNTGVNPDANGPDGQVSLSWTYETSEWTKIPTIVDDTVYLMGRNRIFAVDITDKTKHWSTEVGRTGYRSVAVKNNTVYVPTFENIRALDADTGNQKWSTQDGGPVSPTISDQTIYTSDASTTVFALNTSNGERKWEATVGDETHIWSTPAYSGGTLLVAIRKDDQNGFVRAFDAQDGEEQWEFQTGGISFSAPAIHNQTLVVPDSTGAIYALDVADGSEQWSHDTGDTFSSPPAVVDETVYVGSQEGTLYALSLTDGEEDWSSTGIGFVSSGPTVADETVYLAAGNSLYAFDTVSGDHEWEVMSEMTLEGPILSGGKIYVGGHRKTQETPNTKYTGQMLVFSA